MMIILTSVVTRFDVATVVNDDENNDDDDARTFISHVEQKNSKKNGRAGWPGSILVAKANHFPSSRDNVDFRQRNTRTHTHAIILL